MLTKVPVLFRFELKGLDQDPKHCSLLQFLAVLGLLVAEVPVGWNKELLELKAAVSCLLEFSC